MTNVGVLVVHMGLLESQADLLLTLQEGLVSVTFDCLVAVVGVNVNVTEGLHHLVSDILLNLLNKNGCKHLRNPS
jgi:hypothetical protein